MFFGGTEGKYGKGERGMERTIRIIPYEERFRDDMIFMVLEAKDALGLVPTLREDLLDVRGNYLETGDGFWLAVEADEEGLERVLGCVGFRSVPGGDEAFLHRFFVKAARKRQGIGTALLETAEKAVREAGKNVLRVHLGGDPEVWFESRAFYRKHGFTEYMPRYMEKRLSGGES